MYSVFRNLAIIILSAKFFGLVARKFKAPQVVGEIIAGLIIGPCLLNLVHISDTISIFAEIGVVLLMFSTGLGTNLKELIKAGPIATLIACVGVAVPLAGGTLLYSLFYGFSALGSQEFYRALFIGNLDAVGLVLCIENIIEYFTALSVEQNSNMVLLPVSKKQLADYFGVQRPSFFRELKNMQDQKLIEISNKQVALLFLQSE